MKEITDPLSPQALMVAAIPRLRRFSAAISGSAEIGEDLAQTALERAIANIDRWRPGTSMESWLLRIAYNAWIDDVRARKRRGPHLPVDAANETWVEDGRVVVESRLDLATIRNAIADLPVEFRSVLSLVAIEGFSYQEVADILKVPIGTVMSRLSRARKSLVELIDRAGDRHHD